MQLRIRGALAPGGTHGACMSSEARVGAFPVLSLRETARIRLRHAAGRPPWPFSTVRGLSTPRSHVSTTALHSGPHL